MKRALGLLGAVILLASSTASAQERAGEEPKAEEPERSWYGYQTLAADGVAVVATGLGVQSLAHEGFGSSSSHATSEMLLVTGGLTYLLASPTIHALHGHWGKAGGSLGLRAAPIGLCAAAVAAGGKNSGTAGAAVLFVGIVAAMIIDSSVLANETVAPAPKAALAPTFDPKSRAAGLAFAATF